MRKRNIRIDIMLNDIEYEKLIDDVKKNKSNVSAYIRNLILKNQLKEKPDERFYAVLKELTAMGNNINQIARKANSTDVIDKDFYLEQSTKWNNFVRDIRREFL